MALSRRAFLAAAAAGLAACSKSVHRVVGSASTTVAPSGVTPGRPTTTAEHVGPAALAYSGPRGRKMVAFTFHGSGALVLTQEMLDLTKRLSAPITVFAVGTWLQQNPDVAHRILDAGHELENHTYTHPPLGGASAATIAREVVGCRDVLRAQTGSGGTYFRPSGIESAYPEVIMAQAGAAGYGVVCGTLLTSPLWAAVSPTPTQRPPPKRSAESWAGGARCWSAEDWAASWRPPVGAPKRAEV